MIEVFDPSITKITQSALHQKLLLSVVEEGEFAYSRTSFDEEHDSDRMEPYRQAEGWRRLSRFSYTAFSGVRLTLFNVYVNRAFDSVSAAVRL